MEAFGPRALLVEDETLVRELFTMELEEAGFRVRAVADGRDAIAVLEACADRFDVVLLDMGLPGAPGELVLACAKSLRPDLPVIAITGDAGTVVGAADAILEKPCLGALVAARAGELLAARV